MGGDTIAAAFRTAVRDDKVRAIVFRVDSPGGSAVASDTVWREVNCAREAGKPVVVLETEDGPLQVAVAQIAYYKRIVRAGRVGFGSG